jgi:hypothetical protein
MANGATLAGPGSEINPPDLPWQSRLDVPPAFSRGHKNLTGILKMLQSDAGVQRRRL